MTLFHHDARNYTQAATDAARFARGIMEKKIEEGRSSAMALLERVNTQVPRDSVVRAKALQFYVNDAGVLKAGYGSAADTIHKHALGQMAGKAGIPGAYLAELVSADPWQKELASHILGRHFNVGAEDEKYLVRSVNNEVRGFLSDRFRRLDSRPLLDAFAASCAEIGAVPVDGTFSDTRVALKAFLPMVFEPVPNEVMCLGIEWANSDFGAARHTVRAMIWRLWCTNKATMEDSLTQVHLGRQLGDDIEFSNQTYEFDTKTSVSALGDIVRGVLGPAKVNTLLATIKSANEKNIEWKDMKNALGRRLLKNEMVAVEQAYQSDDVVNLPEGKTAWRASNAISWIAGKTDDANRRLELERLAGEVVNGKRDAKVEEAA